MKSTNKLVVLGSVNADHVLKVPHFPRRGETLTGRNYQVIPGGKGANQAVAAARLGADTAFIAAVGRDDFGSKMKRTFIQDGINVEAVEQIDKAMTGIAMIQVSDAGENSIAISAEANAYLTKEIVRKHQRLIFGAEMLLMQLETPLEAVLEAASLAREAGVQVILNPAPAKALPDQLLSGTDIITPNEIEAEELTGIQVQDENSAAEAATILHAKGIQTVLITLGAKGVWLNERNQKGRCIPSFSVEAVDTTAAGDTFNGALLTALLEKQPMEDAIRFAHAAAALSVTRSGAQTSIPRRAEVEFFLQHQP